MRPKFDKQIQFSFQPSHLKVTNDYYERYRRISEILDQNSDIVDAVHEDIQEADEGEVDPQTGQVCYGCSSETLLRIVLCQIIEGASLRDIVVRIDDSCFLRWFVRIHNDAMIDYSTLCRLRGRIRDETWKRVHKHLNRWAADTGRIRGERLRLDTTAVETNIHWPTDSSLLWDSYRVLARLVGRLRKQDRRLTGKRRLQVRRVRRLYLRIARAALRRGKAETLKKPYSDLIRLVCGLQEWVDEILAKVAAKPSDQTNKRFQSWLEPLRHYRQLSRRVVDQARRRVLEGEAVPNNEKLFSIFEPHSELLKRGKATRSIEFGHMVQIQQVEGKFITGYDVFENKPVEARLLQPALEEHKKLFGDYPDEVAADKGYAQSAEQMQALPSSVREVGVARAGRPNDSERQREHAPSFRRAQRFRAGVEGTISFLKRSLGMARCLVKGWPRYAAAVGASLLAHNLLILARG
jgi:IS5 family transposase